MKTNLNEEIDRIKTLMSINEAVLPEVVSFLSKTLGYFDNVAKLTDDFSKVLKQTDRIKFNDFESSVKDIVRRNLPNVDVTYLSPQFLVRQIATYGDDVAKKELLYFLNTQSDEIAQYTTRIIKNDEALLKNVSSIEKSVLEGQLTNLGLESRFINDITSSLYVDAKKMAEFVKSWKVNWDKTSGMRAEFADAIKQLDATPEFNKTYKRLINDEKYMSDVIGRMYKEVSSKTKEQAVAYLEKQFTETLEALSKSGDSAGLEFYKKYWNWATALKTRMSKDASLWKKTYTSICSFYFMILLPPALLIETIYWHIIRNEEETKQKFANSEKAAELRVQIEKGEKTAADYDDAYNIWGIEQYWLEVGEKSTIIPYIFKVVGSGALKGLGFDFEGSEKTIEQKMKDGMELLKIKNSASGTTKTTTYVNQLDDKDGKKGFKSWLKTEFYNPQNSSFTAEDERVMVQDNIDKNIYYYTPYDNKTQKDLPKITFEFKDGKFQEKK